MTWELEVQLVLLSLSLYFLKIRAKLKDDVVRKRRSELLLEILDSEAKFCLLSPHNPLLTPPL